MGQPLQKDIPFAKFSLTFPEKTLEEEITHIEHDVYATLARRIKAGVLDGVIILSLLILIPVVLDLLVGDGVLKNGLLMYAPVLLLEPLLVRYLGASIGQYVFGMQVMKVDTRGKCPLPMAFIRYYVKILLGSMSLIYMLFSKKHQAIHDHIANTIVLLSKKRIERDPAFANLGSYEQTFEPEYIYPSALRRFGVFILWYLLIALVLVVVVEMLATLLLPGHTFESGTLPEPLAFFVHIAIAVAFIVIAVFASMGYLPGARRKKQ